MTTDNTNKPIRVKFFNKGGRDATIHLWTRQLPSQNNTWGRCEFIFDKGCSQYDWLVVYDDLSPSRNERFSIRKETLACNPRNTLLVTSEPSTIKVYGHQFLQQFGHILTTQEPWVIKHPNATYSQCGFRWYYGIGKNYTKSWDEIDANIPDHKTDTISTVCSSKKQKNTIHAQRFAFTQKLKDAIPDIEIYGHGVRDLDDKSEAVDPYKYHVVIENHHGQDHWTEKLADAFLGHTLPFYYGCTNVVDYFPENAFILIDPYEEEKSIEIIRSAIENNEYEKRLDAIDKARKLVLNSYNFFATAASFIEEHHQANCKISTSPKVIMSRRAMRRKNPLNFVSYFAERYFVKFKHCTAKKS